MQTPHHFYLTFNPYLNEGHHESGYTQAHEFYDFLKGKIEKDPTSRAHWGKIIGADRQSNLDLMPFLEVLKENNKSNVATHLYITDFSNIWVGKVESVRDKISKKNLQALSFYEHKNVEVWFELSDFSLLEYSPDETAKKLQDIFVQNVYNDIEIQGLSPFTTGIKFPLIVQDFADEAYFDEIDKNESGHLILKHNSAVTNTNSAKILHNIHSFAFHENLYNKIPYAAKVEIEGAELDISDNRHQNMGRNAFSYLKAFEIMLNDVIIHSLKRAGFGKDLFVKVDNPPPKLFLQETNGAIPISEFKKNYSMGQLIYFFEKGLNSNHFAFRKTFKNKKSFVLFITKELKITLKNNSLIEIRNLLAHGGHGEIDSRDALAVRNILLGIGHVGLIHKLYQTFYQGEFDHCISIKKPYGGNQSAHRNEDKKPRNKLKLVA